MGVPLPRHVPVNVFECLRCKGQWLSHMMSQVCLQKWQTKIPHCDTSRLKKCTHSNYIYLPIISTTLVGWECFYLPEYSVYISHMIFKTSTCTLATLHPKISYLYDIWISHSNSCHNILLQFSYCLDAPLKKRFIKRNCYIPRLSLN